MKFYKIDNNYIEYLRKYDNRIYDNKNEKRPYIGIIILGNGNSKYFIPITSPKEKHENMKESIDFKKIENKKGILGVLNINYMIPVPSKAVLSFSFENEVDYKYRMLLYNEYHVIKSRRHEIIKNAIEIYKIANEPENSLNKYQKKVKNRSLNFRDLENLCEKYKNQNSISKNNEKIKNIHMDIGDTERF